jgi:multidrug transporter EmrE-like cation transporter
VPASDRKPLNSPTAQPIVSAACSDFKSPEIRRVLYGALSLLYVWILTFTPLSRAYPFVALAFAPTPALAAWLFGEPVSFGLIIGISLILCGLLLVLG